MIATSVLRLDLFFSEADRQALELLKENHSEWLSYVSPIDEDFHPITDSSSRYGYFIFSANSLQEIEPYLPKEGDYE